MSSPSRTLRFLVVEDTEDIRAIVTWMIRRQGHEVEEAADGLEAVEILGHSDIDIMLLDLSMPRMSGEDVVRWMRAHPEAHSEPLVVVISAWAGDRRADLAELGVQHVLSKPLRRHHLDELVELGLRYRSRPGV
ncbi:response regulator [Nocardioides acrostichi]|uniref:Response regulator n=1 Tax=Nocardioides acrostichi TaxID=2784339 RepID=A0A930UV07_9ACTN|nr:response regulator [Nocardioides acrostichi]MBF4160122.1 response regulator [Nocardioides acrostichi]